MYGFTTALLLCAVAQHPDWPSWRGPGVDGVAPPGPPPPLEWSPERNVVWKAEVPGRGHGSPVVVGPRVFLAACDETGGVQSLLAFDRDTGKRLWETVVHPGGAMRKNPKSTGASGTPACDGERVYISFPNGGALWTSAFDLEGRILWQVRISDYVVHQGYGASPALWGPLVLAAADNKGGGAVAALDRKSGAVVWRRERPMFPNYASPVVVRAAGREQLVLTGCDLVTSLDPATGATLWEVPGATTECVTTTVSDGAHVFSSGGYPKNHLAAVAADGSGRIVWETKDRVYVPSLLVKDGFLYGVLDAGIAACWDAATGRERWRERLGGTFSASLVRFEDRIYAVNESGEATVYRASPDGFTRLGGAKLGDEAFATPAICGGRIYARVAFKSAAGRQERLYCLGE
jgi:outer membrane protein assembly factor BamB